MTRSGDVMRSDRLKQVMQQIDENFDEKNAGFSRFSKFVQEAGHKGLIKLSRMENGQYEVAPAEGAEAAPARAEARTATDEAARQGRTRRPVPAWPGTGPWAGRTRRGAPSGTGGQSAGGRTGRGAGEVRARRAAYRGAHAGAGVRPHAHLPGGVAPERGP